MSEQSRAEQSSSIVLSRLRKVFHAERDSGSFSLKLFGFPIIDYTPHILMSFTTSADDNIQTPLECSGVEKITDENAKDFASSSIRDLLRSQTNGPCEWFGVWKEPGIPAGYLRVLYKGSAIGRYRVRNIDAFIVNVFVNAEFRRKGYGEYLLRKTLATCTLTSTYTLHISPSA